MKRQSTDRSLSSSRHFPSITWPQNSTVNWEAYGQHRLRRCAFTRTLILVSSFLMLVHFHLSFLSPRKTWKNVFFIISQHWQKSRYVYQQNNNHQHHSRKRMGKRTKKVGITGKYGTRYRAMLRKLMRKIETSQHSKFCCVFCGKDSVCRTCVGFWHCKHCRKHTLQTHTQHTQSVRENQRELERNPRRMMCVIIHTVRLLLVVLSPLDVPSFFEQMRDARRNQM